MTKIFKHPWWHQHVSVFLSSITKHQYKDNTWDEYYCKECDLNYIRHYNKKTDSATLYIKEGADNGEAFF